MVNAVTKRFISQFESRRAPTMFLTGLTNFNPIEHVYNGEQVTIDIMRTDEEISIAQRDLSTGWRDVTSETFTNKEFTPPVHQDKHALNAHKLISRQFGQNPFDDPDVIRNAVVQAARNISLISDRIARSTELQMSQVLQTGIITLTDAAGDEKFRIDYAPKATHFPTTGTSWTAGAGDPISDLGSLAEVIRNNGLVDVTDAIMGTDAFNNFIANTGVKEFLDNRRMGLGEIRPAMVGKGATFKGTVWVDDYRLNIWTYTGRFIDPSSGLKTKYIADDKVVLLAALGSNDGTVGTTRIDLTYGRIPRIRAVPAEARRFIPGDIIDRANRIALNTNAWFTDDGQTLNVGAGIRPLVIPVGIDQYGCLDTVI